MVCFSNTPCQILLVWLIAFNSPAFKVLVYKDLASKDTKYPLSGTDFIFLLHLKSQ